MYTYIYKYIYLYYMLYFIYVLNILYIIYILYIYIYIVFNKKINFISKSIRQCLDQLHIYTKILLQLSNLQIVFLHILIFYYYKNGNTNIRKITKRKLRKN